MDVTDTAQAYISALDDPRRQPEAAKLDAIFRQVTRFEPRLWAGKMIGYGSYDYTYDSGHSGTMFATGFAVPKRQITLYIMPGYANFGPILNRLGKHRKGKSCLYLNNLSDADEVALRDLIRAGLDDLATRWPVRPT